MERKEKEVVDEREQEIEEDEEEEEMGKKLRRGLLVVNSVGNRRAAGPSTPSPTWRLDFLPISSSSSSSSPQPSLVKPATTDHKPVSARKLCANLWEIEHFSVPKIRRDKPDIANVDPGDGPSDPHQLLGRRLPHHISVKRNGPSLQLGSPASYHSSPKIEPFKPPTSPTRSLDSRNRNGEPSRGLKTSTELVKFLNRICRLEKKHESNMALVKALRRELDQCRIEIGDLQHGEESKLPRKKSKEQEWLKAALRSVGDELRDERKLRKRSENLHRKVARELSDMKYAFSEALKELDEERNTRGLLESLCDEFAKAVKRYDEEVRLLKGKSLKERKPHDRLILQISEAWLDQRLQIKMVEDKDDLAGKNIVVDKLGRDIEALLKLNQSTGSRKRGLSNRRSMESYPLNYNAENCDSNPHYLEHSRSGNRKGTKASSKEKHVEKELVNSSNSVQKRIGSRNLEKDETLYGLQEQLDGSSPVACNDINETRKDDKLQVGVHGMEHKCVDRCVRNLSLSSEGDRIHPEGNMREDESSLACPPGNETSGSCSKFPTLQAKLMEARLESRRSRSRASRASL